MEDRAGSVQRKLRKFGNPEKAKLLGRFFKAGKGGYAEGDKFIGVTVPEIRSVAREFAGLKLAEVQKLLKSFVHEDRLCALLILVFQFQKGDEKVKEAIFDLYLANTKYINNWDLVDLSAGKIVGKYLVSKNKNILTKLAKSDSLWERRIAIISTSSFLEIGESKETIKISEMLINDKHDLIHKAVGWMLREMGKRVSEKALTDFLDKNYSIMPRTMLRYSIERLPEKRRLYYLHL